MTIQNHHRQQLLLFSGVILLFCAFTGTIITVHPLYIEQFVKRAELVGLIAAIVYLVELLLSVPIGALSDKIGRKRLLIASFILVSIVLFAFSINNCFYALILLQIAFGAFTVQVWTVGEAFIRDISPEGRRGEFRSFFGTFANAGLLIGPIIGGYLTMTFGIRFPYLFASFTLTAPLILLFKMKEKDVTTAPFPLHSLQLALNEFLHHSRLKILALCSVSLYFWYSIKWTFGPLFLHHRGYGAQVIGIWLGLSVLPFLLFQIPIGKLGDKIGKTKMIYLGVCISIVFIVPLGFLKSIVGLFSLIFLVSMGTTLVEPLIDAEVTDIVPEERYGSYSGIFELAKTLGLLLGPIVSAIFVYFGGLIYSFIPAVIFFAAVIIVMLIMPTKKKKKNFLVFLKSMI
jgi:MFS family permease